MQSGAVHESLAFHTAEHCDRQPAIQNLGSVIILQLVLVAQCCFLYASTARSSDGLIERARCMA